MPADADPSAPWLAGLVATATADEARAVVDAARRRQLRVRSVPAGTARAAWTAGEEPSLLAIVLTGVGPRSAAAAAAGWAARARSVAVAVAGSPTTALVPPAVVLEGDVDLVAAAQAHARRRGIVAVCGRVATTSAGEVGDLAQASLALAGWHVVQGSWEPWAAAAARLGLPAVACVGVPVAEDRAAGDPYAVVRRATSPGRAQPPWWQLLGRRFPGGRRDGLDRARSAVRRAAAEAAECALAALLGPPP